MEWFRGLRKLKRINKIKWNEMGKKWVKLP